MDNTNIKSHTLEDYVYVNITYFDAGNSFISCICLKMRIFEWIKHMSNRDTVQRKTSTRHIIVNLWSMSSYLSTTLTLPLSVSFPLYFFLSRLCLSVSACLFLCVSVFTCLSILSFSLLVSFRPAVNITVVLHLKWVSDTFFYVELTWMQKSLEHELWRLCTYTHAIWCGDTEKGTEE